MSSASGASAALRQSPFLKVAAARARRVSNLAAQARATARKGVTVVYYHRIVASERDPWRLGVTPEHFAEQMEVLGASGRPLLTFGGLVERMRAGRVPDRAVAVTFDDGYADNVVTALPILEDAGVPATFFVCVDAVDAPGELWWDELERIFLAEPSLPASIDVDLGGRRVRADLGDEGPVPSSWLNHQPTDSPRATLFLELWRLLLTFGLEDRDEAMDQLAEWSGRPRTARPDRRLLSQAQLERMAASPAAEVGCHTFRHPNLTLPNDRYREVALSRAALAARIGAPVTTFAYPNGFHDDAAVAAVADAGYRGACTTERGIVTPRTAVFTVPRYWAPDDGRAGFRRFVRALG